MYLCKIVVEGNCSLSELASRVDQPILLSNVVVVDQELNSLTGLIHSKKIEETRREFASDFINLNITKDSIGIFFNGVKRDHGIIKGIISSGNTPLFPVVIKEDKETFTFLSRSIRDAEKARINIQKHNRVETSEMYKASYSNFASNVDNYRVLQLTLTPKESKIVKTFYDFGYFQWPRKNNLASISKKLGVSKPTASYHLRNAENKLMDILIS